MTLRYYQTSDMEAAVRSMAQRNREVLVLMDYKSVRPIRMRTKAKLGDLSIEWCMAWKPESAPAVERWRRSGGILQYRSAPLERFPYCPPSDSILFVECPMQWDRFEHTCQSARQEVVIYRPPVWTAHTETIEHLYPSREVYETMDAFLDALAFTGQSRFAHSRFERSVWFRPDQTLRLFGWDEKFVRYVLRGYKYSVHRWHPYTLRFKPDHPDLLWAWNILHAQPRLEGRTHLLRMNVPKDGRLPGFASMLKALVKGKYVRVEDCIYDADADRRSKDVDERDAVNNMRRGRWFRMRNFVDDLPEYPV